MKISAPFGSACIGDDPVILTVTDCENLDGIVWTVLYKPEGSTDPIITSIGDGDFQVTAAVKGSYVLEAECCG